MLTFWIAAALLIVAALAFVLVPLLRPRARTGPSVREANLAVLRGQRQDIENDVALGLLPRDARENALAELAARAEEDLNATGDTEASVAKRPWAVAAFFAVFIPAVAVAFYLWVGTPEVTDPKALAAAVAAAGKPSDHQIEEMITALERKMQERQSDVEGWMLLARSYAATGKMEKALAAYAHLVKLAPDDASILANYADTLALARGRNLAGEPMELVQRALKADPKHPKALALAGTAYLNSGQYAESLVYWERLYAVFPAGSSEANEARDIIEDVRARSAAAGKPLPPSKVLAAAAPARPAPEMMAKAPAAAPSPAVAAPVPAAKASPAGKSVSGTVKLGEALAGKTAATDTLFIYARAETGSRIPLAILRGGAGELPKSFELDDSMSMSPSATLSAATSVVIEARVSKAGGAAAQSGDLIGTSKPVAPGAKGVAIVIDKVVP